MTRHFRIEPEAAVELREAARWYEKQRSGLGTEFLQAVDEALEFIGRFPRAGAPVPGIPPDLPIRHVPLKRFPFHVAYLELSDVVRVLAFAHDRRSPGYWHSRIRN